LLAPTRSSQPRAVRRSPTRCAERHGIAATLDNLAACRAADTVLLTLKPQRIAKVLHQPGIREALAGKLVVSIAAGVTLTQLAGGCPSRR
jgi:pyrroline-5-carboxylate reductase